MASASALPRTPAHKPALAAFAAIGSVWVFLLVTLGAFTTSIGAGMVFPDWPLSNGSINPEGWLTDVAKFAEHSHRLTGMIMGFITIALAIWLWRRDAPVIAYTTPATYSCRSWDACSSRRYSSTVSDGLGVEWRMPHHGPSGRGEQLGRTRACRVHGTAPAAPARRGSAPAVAVPRPNVIAAP